MSSTQNLGATWPACVRVSAVARVAEEKTLRITLVTYAPITLLVKTVIIFFFNFDINFCSLAQPQAVLFI